MQPGTVVISAIGGTAGVGQDRAGPALGAPGRRPVPGRAAVCEPARLRPLRHAGRARREAVRRFLDALGVPPERIPPTPEAQAGLYRSLLAGRRMLIVLDNARDAAAGAAAAARQRRAAWCWSPAAASSPAWPPRDGRPAAHPGPAHPRRGARICWPPGSAPTGSPPSRKRSTEIAGLCARLPLALADRRRPRRRPARPAAGRAWPPSCADAAGRLDALDAGDPAASVRAVFSWSYRQLSAAAARMFRLLGLHPGPDISVPAAASLAGAADGRGPRRRCAELARAHLITEHVPGRYAFHDLLRAYAAEQARDPRQRGRPRRGHRPDARPLPAHRPRRRHAARPGREPVALAPPSAGAAAGAARRSTQQALAWFEAEHQVLLAAVDPRRRDPGSTATPGSCPWAMSAFLRLARALARLGRHPAHRAGRRDPPRVTPPGRP